jgi:hypothetical protein
MTLGFRMMATCRILRGEAGRIPFAFVTVRRGPSALPPFPPSALPPMRHRARNRPQAAARVVAQVDPWGLRGRVLAAPAGTGPLQAA